MTAISKWLANKISAAYRRKRFVRAASMRAWYRGASVLLALGALLFFMKPSGIHLLAQIAAVPIAMGYFWTDAHYGSKSLRRRHLLAELTRQERAQRRELQMRKPQSLD